MHLTGQRPRLRFFPCETDPGGKKPASHRSVRARFRRFSARRFRLKVCTTLWQQLQYAGCTAIIWMIFMFFFWCLLLPDVFPRNLASADAKSIKSTNLSNPNQRYSSLPPCTADRAQWMIYVQYRTVLVYNRTQTWHKNARKHPPAKERAQTCTEGAEFMIREDLSDCLTFYQQQLYDFIHWTSGHTDMQKWSYTAES